MMVAGRRTAASMMSRLISAVKGSPFQVDERIDGADLARVLFERAVMKARGFRRFPLRSHRPFIGPGARFKAARMLHFQANVTFGANSLVDALSTDGVHLGHNTSVGRNTRIEATGNLRNLGVGIRVGDNVGLGTDCFYGCAGGISIGDDTIVGNSVSVHSENHNMDDLEQPIRLQGVHHQGVTIGRDCWIGAKATILDGAQIGDGCVIAAGSVVVAGQYDRNGIYGGVPARLIKKRSE
jgi:acetyltransferase-like isoleucine patch superfamily enzyme